MKLPHTIPQKVLEVVTLAGHRPSLPVLASENGKADPVCKAYKPGLFCVYRLKRKKMEFL